MNQPVRHIAAALTVLTSLLGGADAAAAQTSNLQGAYTLTSAGGPDIKAAVDAVADQLNFLVRAIGRDRLMAANPVLRTVAISLAGSDVTIAWNGNVTVTTRTDGASMDWTAPDGVEGQVATIWAGPVLERTFTTSTGLRRNAYSLDATGKVLTLEVTVESPQLPAPVRYKLLYRRDS